MCARCGLIFTKNIFPPDFYYGFVNTFYGLAGENPSNSVIKLQKYKYKKIKTFLPLLSSFFSVRLSKKSLLEVSSFYGIGLDAFQNAYNTTGIEPASNAAEYSYKLTKGKCKIINDCYENSIEHLTKYDVILFTFAFRQIADQHFLLDSLKKLINKNGYLIICEGHLSDFIYCESLQSMKNHFRHYKNAYYTSLNLRIALETRGFEYIETAFFQDNDEIQSSMSIIVFKFNGAVSLPSESDFINSLNHSRSIYSAHMSLK